MPLPSTMTPIATSTLTTATASVTFSSLPQGYTDLVLIVNSKGTAAANPGLRFNGDTGTNYSSTELVGYAGSALSGNYASTTILKSHWAGNSMNGIWTSFIANIQNYSNSTTYKSVLTRYNASAEVDANAGLWRSTAAITSITVITDSNSYDVGSSFTLYGIKAA